MMKKNIKKLAVLSMLIALTGMPAVISARDSHNHSTHVHPAHEPASAAANPLLEEMAVLDSIFREVVSAVALGDGERAHNALHSMHGKMEKTNEGVHSGTVRIPKNADKVKEFVKMDKEFHDNLEALAMAAHKSNQKEMLSLTKKALDGCVSCHQTFRK